MFRFQRAGGLRGLRIGVLHVLRLIQNHREPLDVCNRGRKRPQLRVVDDDEIGAFARGGKFFRGFPTPQTDAQAGIKSLSFGKPIVHDGFGADDQAGGRLSLLAQPGQPRQRLKCFAQTHVVGQHAAKAV